MDAVIFTGIQGSGKSSFYRDRFAETHVRINLDMLRTRHREEIILEACLRAKQPFVIDNTNPQRTDRQRYITVAREAGFAVRGFFFRSAITECMERNRSRSSPVPDAGVLGTHARLEIPSLDEGFSELHYVSLVAGGGFKVDAWRIEGRSNEV